jgi:hypothetical protein
LIVSGVVSRSIVNFPLGAALDLRLNELARAERTRLAVIVLSAFVVAPSRWCRHSGMVLGFVSNGRYRDELRDMVGFMADILTSARPNPRRTQFRPCRARGNSRARGGARALRPQSTLSVDAALSSDLVFNWVAACEPCTAGDIDGARHRISATQRSMPRKFLPVFKEAEQGIVSSITYESARFSRRSVDAFARRFIETADKLVSRPSKAMDARGLPLLDADFLKLS